MRSSVLLAVGAVVAWLAPARAIEQPVAGQHIRAIDILGKRSIILTAKDPAITLDSIGAGNDRRLRITTEAGEFGYTLIYGGLRIKDGYLKVRAYLPITLDEPSQGSIAATIVVGDGHYCVLFGGTILNDEVGRFRARKAPPPAMCPDLCAPDSEDPTIAITGIESPCCTNLFDVQTMAHDDRELYVCQYASYDVEGCPADSPCDAPCWTRAGLIDSETYYSCASGSLRKGSSPAPGATKCIEVTAKALDACGHTSAEAVLRTSVCPDGQCS